MDAVKPNPGFWMNETSGVLRPVIEAFIWGAPLSTDEVAILRSYLRQWMEAPWQPAGPVQLLRDRLNHLHSTHDLHEWLDEALEYGIDPL